MRTPLVFDSQPISSRRERTKEGYLRVPGLIAASDNVQPYFARELGLDKKGYKSDQVVRVYRPKAEVDKAVGTYDQLPITLEHPTRMINAKTWRAVSRGESHNPRVVDSGIEADLIVRDEQTIKDVEDGIRKELSAGYDFRIEMKSGVSPRGEAYDAIASDFEGNHIAITKRARGGHSCRVADSTEKGAHMRVLVFDALLLGTATPTQLPEMEDNAASAVDTLVRGLCQARDRALEQRDALLEECQARLDAQAKDHQTAIEKLTAELPAKIETEARDRASVLAGAEKLGIKLVVEGKDTVTLRREVLTEAVKDAARKQVMDAMVPDLAKATPEALSLATAALFALPTGTKTPVKGHDALGKALSGKTPAKDAASQECSGREASMKASANAWRRGKKD